MVFSSVERGHAPKDWYVVYECVMKKEEQETGRDEIDRLVRGYANG
jgi:hypothetical protein